MRFSLFMLGLCFREWYWCSTSVILTIIMLFIKALSGYSVLTTAEIQSKCRQTHTCASWPRLWIVTLLLSVERDSWWLIMVRIYRILHLIDINLEVAEVFYDLSWNPLCCTDPEIYANHTCMHTQTYRSKDPKTTWIWSVKQFRTNTQYLCFKHHLNTEHLTLWSISRHMCRPVTFHQDKQGSCPVWICPDFRFKSKNRREFKHPTVDQSLSLNRRQCCFTLDCSHPYLLGASISC